MGGDLPAQLATGSVKSMELLGFSLHEIERAAAILRAGGLVAFPTETVYGLGARADDARAVTAIFAAKGRPADHPLIVHLARADEIERWARDIPDVARDLAARFWPGPLTLILKRSRFVSDVVTGGQDTIGLRVPNHPVALALLQATGEGVAAPSANRFGRLSPTTADHVRAELGDAVDCILDGGACSVGLESTILDLSGGRPRVLRPGAITADALAEPLRASPGAGTEDAPRVPGSCPAHYAPGTPVRLLEAPELGPAVSTLLSSGGPIAVLALRAPLVPAPGCEWRTMPADPSGYARVLYARLREADTTACRCILVERPPDTIEWEAIRDRLERATAGATPNKRGDCEDVCTGT